MTMQTKSDNHRNPKGVCHCSHFARNGRLVVPVLVIASVQLTRAVNGSQV